MSRENVDPAELREDIETIKDAMGLEERYEGAAVLWLAFGGLVAVAAGLSQYVFLAELSDWYHPVIWIGLLGGGGAVANRLVAGDDAGGWGSDDAPDPYLQIAVVYAVSFPIVNIQQSLVDAPRAVASASTLATIVVLIGAAYLVVGNTLKAYRIRTRDRYAFYGGGALMVALGTVMPFVDALLTWHYAAFGLAYLAYALASYAVLART
ncbi:hypothetical protein [Halostella litorea]|uniref:hypothetical protein n=1 Tax=Halostella litorea TaxID=2528831 RepID=UPI001092FA06|nr:hypothetical protein [Halostella litorea]